MFSHINHCFHDVQHHLIIIIDGLKSQKSKVKYFCSPDQNVDCWKLNSQARSLIWLKRRTWLCLFERELKGELYEAEMKIREVKGDQADKGGGGAMGFEEDEADEGGAEQMKEWRERSRGSRRRRRRWSRRSWFSPRRNGWATSGALGDVDLCVSRDRRRRRVSSLSVSGASAIFFDRDPTVSELY